METHLANESEEMQDSGRRKRALLDMVARGVGSAAESRETLSVLTSFSASSPSTASFSARETFEAWLDSILHDPPDEVFIKSSRLGQTLDQLTRSGQSRRAESVAMAMAAVEHRLSLKANIAKSTSKTRMTVCCEMSWKPLDTQASALADLLRGSKLQQWVTSRPVQIRLRSLFNSKLLGNKTRSLSTEGPPLVETWRIGLCEAVRCELSDAIGIHAVVDLQARHHDA